MYQELCLYLSTTNSALQSRTRFHIVHFIVRSDCSHRSPAFKKSLPRAIPRRACIHCQMHILLSHHKHLMSAQAGPEQIWRFRPETRPQSILKSNENQPMETRRFRSRARQPKKRSGGQAILCNTTTKRSGAPHLNRL